MTTTLYHQLWKCPYCSDRYDSFDEADECARDCVNVESPIELAEYACIVCKKAFDDQFEAESCVGKHSDDEDSHYESWLRIVPPLKLKEAAEHPAQRRLLEVAT